MGIQDRLGPIESLREANLVVFEWNPDSGCLRLHQTIVHGEVHAVQQPGTL
jgi:imidazolonepropionase-like amidohydrolase